MRIAVAAAAVPVALLLAACGSAGSTAISTSASTSTSANRSRPAAGTNVAGACSGRAVSAGYAGVQGATGHLEVTLALRNVSHRPCRLGGYPTAELLGPDGRALPLRVGHGHGFFPDSQLPARPVTVRPGAMVHVGIGMVVNNEYAHARVCRTATAAAVAMPGWSAPERVSLRRAPRVAPCGDAATVSPVHA